MKRILFSLLLSLPISMVAMDTFESRQDGHAQDSTDRRKYRTARLELKRNAQCTNTISAVAQRSPELAKQLCASYKGKTGEGSSCALMCQYLGALRNPKRVNTYDCTPSPSQRADYPY